MPEPMAPLDDRIIVLHPSDNVVVLKEDVLAGTIIKGTLAPITCLQFIGQGHKLAVRPIAKGEPILKYDQVIGFASSNIPTGSCVHTHNVEMRSFERDHAVAKDMQSSAMPKDRDIPVFQGYRRTDGRAGTRNFIVILSTVNCSATVCRGIADHFRGAALDAFPHVDGVVACTHGFGCMSDARLEKTIAGYAHHPNVAGFLMVGLGCENNSVGAVSGNYSLSENELARYLVIQHEGGTGKTIDKGIGLIKDMLLLANRCRREPIPVSELILGLECGGSDSYSGLTANPALGKAADMLIGYGGAAVLSETPEIFGAEHLLIRRARSPEVAQKLLNILDWWQDYAEKNGVALNNNPSEGNKAGGLTTILEKSLGAVAKGGTSALNDVIGYADTIHQKGLTFMDTPGFDPSSVTGKIAGGANIICFTTGRGSAFGSKPTPSLKIATNTRLYENMPDDMDINAGVIMDGFESLESLGKIIFDEICDVASGKPTKSELNGYGDNEFAPWHVSAIL